ncbi:TonB-dependent receptor [Pseudomaricurvus alkylphenolicus]|uniref:TonB-dependent receptor n=1 Tax=Pseudomaricurvus alkylphenolicus TaxID=1306991 RepID=UPI00141E90EA|nr:TonB-dependent receptor [Pseudomaricurvus alkylphenolicus]NIB43688.1 TonB-dependent receptor [Pseudomaricurvus alkylphenolicus]
MKINPIRKNLLSAGIAASLALTVPTAANADGFKLEEIVVTAQKRQQSLQDVPISVSAVDGEKMSEAGINNLEDLSAYVPNFQQANSPLGQVISIRGISSGINQGFEQSVVQYVDDIAMGRGPMARMPFMDLERVEVLRGPQNVLFGKNSIGGAISITTAKPTEDFEGSVQVEHENKYGSNDVQAMVSGPLSDTVGARLAIRAHQEDGYFDNTTNGDDEQQKDEITGRLTLEWTPNDTFNASLKLEHSSFDFEGRGEEVIAGYDSVSPLFTGLSYGEIGEFLTAATGQDIGTEDGTQNRKRQTNHDEFSDNESNQVVLTMNWGFDAFTLTSVTGYVDYKLDEDTDVDLSGLESIRAAQKEKFDQFSQEIRFTSPGGETIDWIAGAYYQTWDLEYGQQNTVDDENLTAALSEIGLGLLAPSAGITGFNPAASLLTNYGIAAPFLNATAAGRQLYSLKEINNTSNIRDYNGNSDSHSAFGQATWNVSEALRLTLGARYTLEEKESERSLTIYDTSGGGLTSAGLETRLVMSGVFGVENHAVEDDRREESVTGTLIAEWDATEELMLYASISNGFKAGGFDARAGRAANFEYEDETVINYEIGTKAEMLGGRAQLNTAIFYTDYKDLQVSQFDGTVGFVVGNAAAARSQGIEFDGRIMLTEELLLIGSMAYLDYEFKEYEGAACPPKVTLDTGAVACDLSGEPNTFAPELTAAITLDYITPLSDAFNLHITLDTSYRSKQFVEATLEPLMEQDSQVKVNARIALEAENWMVALVGKNLTDNDDIGYASATPVSGSALLQAPTYSGYEVNPRTLAIQAKYHF